MPISTQITSSTTRANLSAEYLQENTAFSTLLRNDYISIGQDSEALFNNDAVMASAIDANTVNIATNSAGIAANAANIVINSNAIAVNASDIAQNAVDIAANTADIAANTLNIATNTADINSINDGRYSPQFGTGSPESVVTSNRSQTYFDLSTPEMWVNPTIGANTGWIQVV